MVIRAYDPADWPQLWPVLEKTFARGDTYAFPVDWTAEETRHAWITVPLATFVAVGKDDQIVGTYYIKANQMGNGAHTANCGYVVSEDFAGLGIATRLCEHSQQEARRLGFLAMQFNFVVATNVRAVSLWQHLGFHKVGTVPRAFRHPEHGLVDAYIMHKWLADRPDHQ
ncbi:MAG: GNAT family N-acetyltransferase [Desulfobulbus sp.]|nr:GNAT family N-acetyltransferase [Desulfobulbus sp.]